MRVPVVALLIGLFPATLAFPQSLGEAAKRQATRRAAEPSAPAKARAYGDEDLKREADAPGGLPQVAPVPEGAVMEATAADDAPPTAIEAPDLADADLVRANLDREAAERRQREHLWRNLSGAARARLAFAEHQNEIACGPGVLVLTGG